MDRERVARALEADRRVLPHVNTSWAHLVTVVTLALLLSVGAEVWRCPAAAIDFPLEEGAVETEDEITDEEDTSAEAYDDFSKGDTHSFCGYRITLVGIEPGTDDGTYSIGFEVITKAGEKRNTAFDSDGETRSCKTFDKVQLCVIRVLGPSSVHGLMVMPEGCAHSTPPEAPVCGDSICVSKEAPGGCCTDCGCGPGQLCHLGSQQCVTGSGSPSPDEGQTSTPTSRPVSTPASQAHTPTTTGTSGLAKLTAKGSPCTEDAQCESGNCRNRVCCLSGMKCCTADSDCVVDERCDTDRYYCVPLSASTPVSSTDKEEGGAFKFFMQYWELAFASLASLGVITYYLQVLKRKTIGEEKVKVKRGVTREGNVVKIGVKVVNDSTFPLVDVGVEMDIPKAFRIEGGSKFIDLGNIKQDEFQSAIFKLVPTRCVSGNITGSVIYHNVKNEKKMIHIEPVTVGSVCPFLEKVLMTEDAFNEKVKTLPANEKRIGFQLDPQSLYTSLQGKCSAMHAVREGYSPDGKHYIGIYSSRGAYSKNFIGMHVDFDLQSKEVLLRVHGEQEEMITGLLSEIVDIVEDVAGLSI